MEEVELKTFGTSESGIYKALCAAADAQSAAKIVQVDIPSIGNNYAPLFVFNQAEEHLLRLVQEHYPYSPLWGTEPIAKMAALIDIYDGCFPTKFHRTLELVLLKSHELVAYCRLNWRPLPKTQCDNSIFDIYRKERGEQCRVFALYTRQLFFNIEQKMQMRERESLPSPQPSQNKKIKIGNTQ